MLQRFKVYLNSFELTRVSIDWHLKRARGRSYTFTGSLIIYRKKPNLNMNMLNRMNPNHCNCTQLHVLLWRACVVQWKSAGLRITRPRVRAPMSQCRQRVYFLEHDRVVLLRQPEKYWVYILRNIYNPLIATLVDRGPSIIEWVLVCECAGCLEWAVTFPKSQILRIPIKWKKIQN